MNFEKDIFISYAHIDDESMAEGIKGWITEFHKSLEVRLSQLLGKHPVIWRDAKLQGNDFFAPEIVSQFPALKIMISIITPRYVKSEWCTREIDEFYKAASENGGISIENKARIFKVIKTPVKRDEQPAHIREILGYEFYRVDQTTGRFKEFSRIFGQEIEQAYWAKLDDVANDIAQLIEKINTTQINGNGKVKQVQGSTSTANEKKTQKKKIYLSDASYDLKEYHENLKRELEDNGYEVLPNKNLAFVADEYCSGVENFINDCSLAIHLVSHTYGLVPEGTDKSIVVLQNEIAAKQSISRGLNRLIWIPPSTHPEDARQQNFIDQLKCNEDLQTGADLLEGTIEELKFSIFDTLRKLEEKEKEMEKEKEKEKAKENVSTADAEAIDDVPKMIYLVCDKRDLDAIKPLEDFLFNSGYEIMLPVFDGEESQLRSEHEENLKQCDAVILYYGNANELWLRSMTRDLLRMPALGRTRNLLSKTAIIAEPSSPQKERFRSHELSVINMLQGFRPEMMDDFIKNLK